MQKTDDRTERSFSRAATIALLLVCGLLLYVLSYAPYLRFRVGGTFYTPYSTGAAPTSFYAPVNILIQSTILEQPLLLWADVWGVRAETEYVAAHNFYYFYLNVP